MKRPVMPSQHKLPERQPQHLTVNFCPGEFWGNKTNKLGLMWILQPNSSNKLGLMWILQPNSFRSNRSVVAVPPRRRIQHTGMTDLHTTRVRFFGQIRGYG